MSDLELQVEALEKALKELQYSTAVMKLYLPKSPYRHLVRLMSKLSLIKDFRS